MLCRLYSMNFSSQNMTWNAKILTQTNLFFGLPTMKLLSGPFGWTLLIDSSALCLDRFIDLSDIT